MRPKFRPLLAGCAALGLVPAILMAAGLAVAGGPANSLVRSAEADPASGTDLPADPLEPDASSYASQIWAGWADVAHAGVKLRYVFAEFHVPSIGNCSTGLGDKFAIFWVGLDGWSTGSTPVPSNYTVEQVGVYDRCEQSGGSWYPHYYGFWEMAAGKKAPTDCTTDNPGDPRCPHLITTVVPGDDINASVYFNDNTNEYNLVLHDNTRPSANISTSQPCGTGFTCHNATAEAIAEGRPSYLASFGTVSFDGVQVTSRDGTRGALQSNSLWNANHIWMQSATGQNMAFTSGRTNNYQNFHVDYIGPG
jgi:Peptidase A4 family